MPLSQHLLRAALIATLFPLLTMVGLGLWQYQQDVNNVEAFTGTESLSSARVVANFMDFLVDDTRTLLDQIAREAERGTITEQVLKRRGTSQRQTEGLEVTDARGVIRVSSIGQQGRDVSALPYFKQVAAGAAVSYSDVFFSQWLKQNVVMMAVPYKVNGRFAGVVMARLHLRELHKLLSARLDDPRLRNTFIADRQGNLVSHYDFKLVAGGTNVNQSPPVKAALGGHSGWLKYESPIDHEERISGYMPMPGTGWAIISSRKTGESILNVSSRLQHQLLLASLAALVAGTSALLWGRRLSRPLEALETTIRGANAPEFRGTMALAQARVNEEVREYETLASGYNAMASAMSTQFNEILALQKELQTKNGALNLQNEDLKRLTEQANVSNRLKSEFLANMSHELRTPLNAIIGYTVLTLTDHHQTLDEQNRHNLETVEKSGRHLLTLINGILDLSKIESGKATVYAEPFDPGAMVEQVMGTLQPLAQERSVHLKPHFDPTLSQVESDETKVRQIVLNLLSNAIKFTHDGAVNVSVEAREGENWAVVVHDEGIGIAPEDQELIFEEFRQVDGSATRQAGGTGLGLSIARKLARLLGGDLTLDSTLGQGSRFTLTLPMHMPVAATGNLSSAALEPTEHPGEPATLLPDRVVLAIDDDPQTLYLTAEKFKGTPYLLVPTSTRETGLKLASVLHPHAILLDVKVRRMDDWKVLRELKADPATADIPVVVLSFEENKALAYSLGAAAYLAKPLERHSLTNTLARLGSDHAPNPPHALTEGSPS